VFVGPALGALFERLPERLLRLVQLHLAQPRAAESAEVVALLGELPNQLLAAVLEIASRESLVRLPEPSLAATRKLLHRAVSAGGPIARRAYPLLSELESKLSVARRT
jgi:hypothetical protein